MFNKFKVNRRPKFTFLYLYKHVILLLLKILLISSTTSIFIFTAYQFDRAETEKNTATFEGTQKIIDQGLNLIFFYNVNLENNNLNLYESKITQIISSEDPKKLYNIVITDVENKPLISNLEKDINNEKAVNRSF